MSFANANSYDKDYLVVGRGRLYFNRLRNGVFEGERYLGNTPELSLSSSTDKLDHFSSDHGFKDKDKSVNIENSRSGSFATDIISPANIALWFGGSVASTIFSAQNDVFEKVNNGAKVTKGRIYQLGVTKATPQGQGGVDGTSFTIGYADANTSISNGGGDISSISGVKVLSTANYELNADTGQLYIEEDAPDLNGEVQIVVKYNRKASSGNVMVSSDNTIEGSLRFVSDNPTGTQKNYFIPKVSISPDGDYSLKGDDWQQMSFTFDVLKRDAATESIYIYDNPTISAGGGDNGGAVVPPATYAVDSVLVSSSDGSKSASVGSRATVKVVVKDSSGNPASGVKVKLTTNGQFGDDISGSNEEFDETASNGEINTSVKCTQTGTIIVKAIVDGQTTGEKQDYVNAS